MENIISIPQRIRGMGNIVKSHGSSDFTTFNTQLFNRGSEIIDDNNRSVFQMEYKNDQIYFLEYPTKIISQKNSQIKGIVKNNLGEPITGATVRLYIINPQNPTEYFEGTTDNQGIVTFETEVLNLLTMDYQMYLAYNNSKSGKILVSCIELGSIDCQDFIVLCKDEQISIPVTIKDSLGKPVSEIPINVFLQGETQNFTTDSSGKISIDYTGNELGDVQATVSCGSFESYFIINDCKLYMYDGNSHGHTERIITHSKFLIPVFQNEGFKLSSPSEVSYGTNLGSTTTTTTNYVGESLYGDISDGSFEFTYLSGNSSYPLRFNIIGDTEDYVLRIYAKNGEYKFVSDSTTTINETLSKGDKFKIQIFEGYITVYKNNAKIYMKNIPASKYAGGFYVEKGKYANYDKFMIKNTVVTVTELFKTAFLRKGVNQLVKNLNYTNNELKFSTIDVEDISSPDDLEGVVYSLRKNDSTGNIKFDLLYGFENTLQSLETIKSKIENAVTNLTYNQTTKDINFDIVGDLDV